MKKILLLDNYDSFTYNLVQLIQDKPNIELTVVRNDQITLDQAKNYDAFVFSPGPGIPSDAGIMKALIARYAAEKPMLGICLGHQAIAEVFGAKLENMTEVLHGIQTAVHIHQDEHPLFNGLTEEVLVGRYHSWVINAQSLPEELEINCTDQQGTIMGIHHKKYPCYGLQFHPESILTPEGDTIIHNFIELLSIAS